MYRTIPLPLINQIAGAFHPDPSGTILVPVGVDVPKTVEDLNRPSLFFPSQPLTQKNVRPLRRLVEGLFALTAPNGQRLTLSSSEHKRAVEIVKEDQRLRLHVSAVSQRGEIQQQMLVDEGNGVHGTGWKFSRNDGIIIGATTMHAVNPNGPMGLSAQLRMSLFDSLMQFILIDDPVTTHPVPSTKTLPKKPNVEGVAELSLNEVILVFVADRTDDAG